MPEVQPEFYRWKKREPDARRSSCLLMEGLRGTMASDDSPRRASIARLSHRRDIDGVRALAVLLVVGFHAFPTVVPGGFVGVDLFFVISGYLITGTILRELDAGTFTYLHFYARRFRRIVPARRHRLGHAMDRAAATTVG